MMKFYTKKNFKKADDLKSLILGYNYCFLSNFFKHQVLALKGIESCYKMLLNMRKI